MKKLTKEKIEEIWKDAKKGLFNREIALKNDVNESTISRILGGKLWKTTSFPVDRFSPQGESNGRAKTSAVDIIRMLEDYKNGLSKKKIALKYNITERHFNNILSGKAWSHLNLEVTEPQAFSTTLKPTIDTLFTEYRNKGYPQIKSSEEEIFSEYARLKHTNSKLEDFQLYPNRIGTGITYHFHPEMELVKSKNCLSPFEAFNDDAILKKVIESVVKKSKKVTDSKLRQEIYRLGGVRRANSFSPSTARKIYQHFNAKKVLDFCAGWGGRALGALSLGIPYIGIDPSNDSHYGNSLMIETVCKLTGTPNNIQFIQGCAEDVLFNQSFDVDFILTSPPYYDLEVYSKEETQSFSRYPDEKDWKEKFVKKSLEGCFKALIPGGKLVLSIDSAFQLELTQMASSIGFKLETPLTLLTSRRPINKISLSTFRQEPLLVFSKPEVKND